MTQTRSSLTQTRSCGPPPDGTLAGDRGFDPKCFVALARTRTSVDSGPWAKLEPEARMVRERVPFPVNLNPN